MVKKAIIYGIKTDETYKYIGKTMKPIRDNRELKVSDVGARYHNTNINDVIINNDVNMVVLKTVDAQEWYDEKLKEVVDKYKDEHPLLNAQWMLDGKKGYWEGTGGYWEGKERDAHTLKRLSESKYKRVVQYDTNGIRVKIWDSGKDVATKVLKDYRVVNGCGCTKLYGILASPTLKSRLRFGSYWFREAELIQYFGLIPKRLNLDAIRKKEAEIKKEKQKHYKRSDTYRRYTVIHCDINGNEIKKYDNIFEAGLAFKLSPSVIGKICRGLLVPKDYILKYGKKEVQPMDVKKYKYETIPINAVRSINKHNKIIIKADDIYNVDL